MSYLYSWGQASPLVTSIRRSRGLSVTNMVARVVPALTTITLWPEPESGPGFIHEPRLEQERDQVRVNISNVPMLLISAREMRI